MVNQALAQRLAARTWLQTPLVVERASRTQTDSGDWTDGWTQVYPSVEVPAPTCYVEHVTTTTGERNVSGQPVVEVETFIYYPVEVTLLASDRCRVNGQTYQVSRILNADETLKATLKALVVKV